MKRLIVTLIGIELALSAFTERDFCGYAPLCGDGDQVFSWQEGEISDDIEGSVVKGAEIILTDCCKLKDTLPLEDCQIVDPSGESYRTLTAEDELCGFRGETCEDATCNEYQIVIKPNFAKESSNEKCCDSCTCFGDPQCISFSGDENIWALCDGREVPRTESIWEMCRITKNQCEKERDHVGNQCQYLANDNRGRDWTVGKQGSPCVPNPESPPSIITMYEVPDVNFKLSLQQGERGIITNVFLDLECGSFELSAEQCISVGRSAWSSDEDIPSFFSYNDVVKGFDQHWSIVDPDSGISVSIRCHANRYDDDETSYVPRINIEDLSDPIGRGNGGSGYCVSGEFDTGLATVDNTRSIFSRDRCEQGLQDSNKREIFRAICQNPSLPSSGHQSCIYHFCNKHYLPQFTSIEECEAEFATSLANGFCKGITYSEYDTNKCVEQWFDLGAVETVQQYYDDLKGCSSSIQSDLDKCQSGLLIQYYRSDQWNTELAIPADYCSDEPIVLSKCDHQYLFNRPIRIVQKAANVACSPVNQCSKIEGFVGSIELVKNTPYPTKFPTNEPTEKPTAYPTQFPITPTSFPTPFPIELDTSGPVPCPVEPLCSTNNENIAYSNDQVSLSFDECCIEQEDVCSSLQERTQSTKEWYCGLSDGVNDGVPEAERVSEADSVSGISCEDRNEIQISVMFTKEEECCKKCTCFGDPRCYSFDNSFSEFVLCDGRTPNEEDESGRCIIRKDTCEQQVDHEGNQCIWANPNKTPPNFSNPEKQAYEESKYSANRYGSPCRYNPEVSQIPTLLMYQTEEYAVEVEHGERGYIQVVHLTTSNGEFKLSIDNCLKENSWEVMAGSKTDVKFKQSTFGREVYWNVEDLITGIVLKVRCTGHNFNGGKELTTSFINVEAILDWNNERIEEANGFCTEGIIREKIPASTSYTASLRNNGLCNDWNEDSDDIIKREVVRILNNNPGITNIGTEAGYREFCSKFFSPYWSSVGKCVNAFMDAKSVQHLMNNFCKAVTQERTACEENLQVLAENGGYKEAFRDAYETYVVNFEKQCQVKFDDLPKELTFNEDTCQTGVELQFYNPRSKKWVSYAAFPDTDGYCSGYKVTALYRSHPKLFKNPLRIVQKYDTQHCSQCTQASGVQSFISFTSEAIGSF